MISRTTVAIWCVALFGAVVTAQDLRPAIDESSRLEAVNAVARGVAFLLDAQMDNGSWRDHPGITAAAAFALARSPEAADSKAVVARALTYVTGHARPDGAISNRASADNEVYSTAMCLLALTMVNRPEDTATIRAGRRFLMRKQGRSGFEYAPGGAGYTGSAYPDLSNTHWALEALYWTDRALATPATDRERQLFWLRAGKLMADCQLESGGFVYYPVARKPEGEDRHPELDKEKAWGSLTYGGLKSLHYAGMDEFAGNVERAAGWLRKHYTLAQNPGLAEGGLYYYYYMFATTWGALEAEGAALTAPPRNWRTDVVHALLQREQNGKWSNKSALWMENKPELCTAYALLAMQIALHEPAR